MAKYILLRDFSANGTVLNTEPAPEGMAAPKYKYLTKKYKKGDVVDGELGTDELFGSGTNKSLFVTESNGVTSTDGIPYTGTAKLAFDLTVGALQKIDDSGNVVKDNTVRNIVIASVSIICILGLLKWQKVF